MQNNSDFARTIPRNMPSLALLIKYMKGLKRECSPVEYSLILDKAFDTVNHAILVRKLEHYGIRGIANDWFVSYLSNRKQFTSIGNINSGELPISCGVPQGSVSWPSAISYLY